MKIVIGSRGSALARVQARQVADLLRAISPSLEVEFTVIKTQGDKILDLPLSKIGDKGLFVKELEVALEAREIDLAIHSVKDLPAEIPGTLLLAAFPKREDPGDVLVTRNAATLDALPPRAVIGTSALRRQSQLLHARPDLRVELLRGNVDTRLRKLDEGKYDGVVLARAGLNRLGINRGVPLPYKLFLPSPGQGALAVEIRRGDDKIQALVRRIDDPETSVCVGAERSFLARMEGGCQVPLGGLASLHGSRLELEGFLGSPDGFRLVRKRVEGQAEEAGELGQRLADLLLEEGGDILKALRLAAGNP